MRAISSNDYAYTTEPSVSHTSPVLRGFARQNPNLEGAVNELTFNLVCVTVNGAGRLNVLCGFRDKDSAFVSPNNAYTIQEIDLNNAASCQYCFLSAADEFKIGYTDGTGDSKYYINIYQMMD